MAIVPAVSGQQCDPECRAKQREALLRLYNALDGPSWQRGDGWRDGAAAAAAAPGGDGAGGNGTAPPHCAWYGVACAPGGAVSALSLASNGLAGSLPPGLETALPALAAVDLGGNQIGGSLPAGLAAAPAMRELRLNNNALEGPLPAGLIGCVFVARIVPPFAVVCACVMRACNLLTAKHTYTCKLIYAHTHASPSLLPLSSTTLLMHSPSLRVLDLSGNRLSAALPADLGAPTALEALRLARNDLTGRLPASFAAALGGAAEVDLTGNRLAPGGALPPGLAIDPGAPLWVAPAGGNGGGSRLLCARVGFAGGNGSSDGSSGSGGGGGEVLLDPSYYGYQGCECERGYAAEWRKGSDGAAALTCAARAPTDLILAAVLAPAGFAALTCAALLLFARRAGWLGRRGAGGAGGVGAAGAKRGGADAAAGRGGGGGGGAAGAGGAAAGGGAKGEPTGLDGAEQVTLVLTDVQVGSFVGACVCVEGGEAGVPWHGPGAGCNALSVCSVCVRSACT